MLNMNFHIEIGNYQLMMVDSVKIKTSVEQLSDTATILLPGSVFNKYLEVESKIARGDKVLIKLGYDDNLVTEFEGYIESISTDDGAITLNCEDELFNYRVSLADVVLINKTAKAKGIFPLHRAGMPAAFGTHRECAGILPHRAGPEAV